MSKMIEKLNKKLLLFLTFLAILILFVTMQSFSEAASCPLGHTQAKTTYKVNNSRFRVYSSNYKNAEGVKELYSHGVRKIWSSADIDAQTKQFDWSTDRTAYCLNTKYSYPSGTGGSFYLIKANNSLNSAFTYLKLRYADLNEKQQKQIGIILSSGYASIGENGVEDETQKQRLIDFKKASGISNITQEQLRGATQCAIWSVMTGGSYDYGNDTVNQAIDYLLKLSKNDYPKVSINETNATYTETANYRIYGPYTADYTGVVKNSIINLQAADNVKILTSKDSTEELSAYNIEKNKEFYVKVYYQEGYENEVISLVTASITYYKEEYYVCTAGDAKWTREYGYHCYLPGKVIKGSGGSGYGDWKHPKDGPTTWTDSSQDVVIVQNHNEDKDFTDIQVKWLPTQSRLTINKVDGSDKELIGAKFELVCLDEQKDLTQAIVTGAKSELSEDGKKLTLTNTSGKISITNLPLAKCQLQEVETVDGYILDDSVNELNFSYENSAITLKKINYKLGNLVFYKVYLDSVADKYKTLEDVTFELVPDLSTISEDGLEYLNNLTFKNAIATDGSDNISYNEESKKYTFKNKIKVPDLVTKVNGDDVVGIGVYGLPQGTYTLTEVSAPEGYIKSDKSLVIEVKADGSVVMKDTQSKDIGFENIQISLDLALEKWVSEVKLAKESTVINSTTSEIKNVSSKEYADRNTYDNAVESRTGDIYVSKDDIVTYTIRIYNHGNVAATATKIVEEIPEGLEFLVDNETNQKYGWKVDENGKLYTTYLADQELIGAHCEKGTAHRGLNYNSDTSENASVVEKSCDKCKYKDIKISFKVKDVNNIKRIINLAEIADYKSQYDTKTFKAIDVDSIIENHPKHDFELAENFNPDESEYTNLVGRTGYTMEIAYGDYIEKVETVDGENVVSSTYQENADELIEEEKEAMSDLSAYYREDDEDIAVIVPNKFDLALEKWVSKVITKDPTTGEEKEAVYDDRNTLDAGTENREGNITAIQGDTVIYTIRVYNQGVIDGFATEIMDSNPKGLEFLPDNEINKLYGWKVDENGRLTTSFLSLENSEIIKKQIADALEAKDKGTDEVEVTEETTGEEEKEVTESVENVAEKMNEILTSEKFQNMYKDGTMIAKHSSADVHVGNSFENGEYKPQSCDKCNYKEIQIAFKVGKTVDENKNVISKIINLAQITKASSYVAEGISKADNTYYLSLDDIDSTPDNYVGDFEEGRTREDDEDIAVILPKNFDLALQKWISSYDITVDGNAKNVQTQQDYNTSVEEKTGSKLVKIDIDGKKIDTTQLKINYTIRVVNEGDLPGYVKELTDYIPEGTQFNDEDNLNEEGKPYWVLDGNKIVTSVAYEDKMNTVMQPGDSQEFKVTLRWIANAENLGLKNNIVEISKDFNEWQVPDKDSDPGNIADRMESKNWEDDEDEVPFILTVKTGEWMIYFGIVFTVLVAALGVTLVIRKRMANRI